MENSHKEFKPYDMVLVRGHNPIWKPDVYAYWNESINMHQVIGFGNVSDGNIIHYEGYEHLVGTTDEPEEEIKLERGEYGFFVTKPLMESTSYYSFGRFNGTTNGCMVNSADFYYDYFIRFSDFNPNDMKETKKHLLCVKNGKVVRYHGKD